MGRLGAVIVCGGMILSLTGSASATDPDNPPYRPHQIKVGSGVPVCVWGAGFLTDCGFGGADFHGAYLYKFHHRFSVGAFFNAGWTIALDMGIQLRTWFADELFYLELNPMVMAFHYLSDDGVWFYGFETVAGLSVPPRPHRVKLAMEVQVLHLFNDYGYLGFLRPFIGLAISL